MQVYASPISDLFCVTVYSGACCQWMCMLCEGRVNALSDVAALCSHGTCRGFFFLPSQPQGEDYVEGGKVR